MWLGCDIKCSVFYLFCKHINLFLFCTYFSFFFMRRTSSKYLSILFLILFIEKSGLRLFIHDAFHKGPIVSLINEKSKLPVISQANCGCLDDFFLPLNHEEPFSVSSVVPSIIEISFPEYEGFTPSFSLDAGQLRGPPSA